MRSLYGETQKPTPEMLEDLDVLVFDIQDIGTRFYTYIWTLYYAMEAAGENDKRFIVLDRPNPLGTDIEGFVLEPELSSFVGLREIPQTHGLTVGELALLFNGEFLDGATDLEVVEMSGYDPEDPLAADLPWVLPSPNIPTPETAVVYAGTGLIEALNISEGRGTTTPFLWFGAPFYHRVPRGGAHRRAGRRRAAGRALPADVRHPHHLQARRRVLREACRSTSPTSRPTSPCAPASTCSPRSLRNRRGGRLARGRGLPHRGRRVLGRQAHRHQTHPHDARGRGEPPNRSSRRGAASPAASRPPPSATAATEQEHPMHTPHPRPHLSRRGFSAAALAGAGAALNRARGPCRTRHGPARGPDRGDPSPA